MNDEYWTGFTGLAEMYPDDVDCKPVREVNDIFESYGHEYRG